MTQRLRPTPAARNPPPATCSNCALVLFTALHTQPPFCFLFICLSLCLSLCLLSFTTSFLLIFNRTLCTPLRTAYLLFMHIVVCCSPQRCHFSCFFIVPLLSRLFLLFRFSVDFHWLRRKSQNVLSRNNTVQKCDNQHFLPVDS